MSVCPDQRRRVAESSYREMSDRTGQLCMASGHVCGSISIFINNPVPSFSETDRRGPADQCHPSLQLAIVCVCVCASVREKESVCECTLNRFLPFPALLCPEGVTH